MIYYYSTKTRNTERFVSSLGYPHTRISKDTRAEHPYILFTATYSNGEGKGAVPRPVIEFLKNNHELMVGVIASGNTNFGQFYGIAGNIISRNCQKPLLYKYELFGTDSDVLAVKTILEQLLNEQKLLRP